LTHACFDGANLSNVRLNHADLRNASFRHADLRGACLAGASLIGCSFCDPANERSAISTGALVDRRTQIDPAVLDDLMPERQAFLRSALAAVGR
jgi:uncharacterized protein YjbI with pentapeptide repeats